MRGGSVRSKSGFGVAALALGACQSIIGVSGYSIEDSPTGGSTAEGGSSTEGGGTAEGGTKTAGGEGGGSVVIPSTGGEDSAGGGGGASGCRHDGDCDDAIDCSKDVCTAGGDCKHEADSALCGATNDECVSCQLGIGCVVGPSVEQELLLDPAFDAQTNDWIEDSDNFGKNIFAEEGSQSGARLAKFGPAPIAAAEREYADLLQHVTIPERTVALRLTGYYRLAPGSKKPAGDYVVAAFYAIGELDPYTRFHSWAGDSGARSEWTAFSYDAPRSQVLKMWAQEYTFDLVAHTFDSVYRFDTLSLTATVCE